MRIDKLLSNLKYGSRKDIKELIKNQAITLNDEFVKSPSIKINPDLDIIKVYGEEVTYFKQLNLMIYKPRGYLSANHDHMHQTIFELLDDEVSRYDLKIAGRLDLDSEGLLILTTSGTLAHKITSPNTHLAKVYEVILDKKINDYTQLLKGVIIKDGKGNEYLAKALAITKLAEDTLTISIDTGKFHQVRRMFEAIGYQVINLKRVQIGNLKLGNLKPGEYQTFKEYDLFD